MQILCSVNNPAGGSARNRWRYWLCLTTLCWFAAPASFAASPEPGQSNRTFVAHILNRDSEYSACAVFDVNRDGTMDIFCGGFWYEGPTWTRHVVREVESIRGRFDDYSNLPLDVDRDGWIDVVSVNYRSQSLYWVRNPGEQGGEWTRHVIAAPGHSETGRLVDLNQDGQLDILPNGTDFAAWYELTSRQPGEAVAWKRHDLPPLLAGHGIGAGDIDGDGKIDLVNSRGWFRSTGVNDTMPWEHHPEFRLSRDAAIPVVVMDVDRDGDSDLIWSRGHHIGVYWMEQSRGEDGQRVWTQHTIDSTWSDGHSLLTGDVDGDGHADLVTGKRYLGHDGRDPAESDPLGIYWYRYEPTLRSWSRFPVAVGGVNGFDTDPKLADVDGDGDLDVVAGSRTGLSWYENVDAKPMTSSPQPQPALNHQRVDQFVDDAGVIRPVASPLDWGRRRDDLVRNMESVMGQLPGADRRVPLDVRVIEEVRTERYTRRRITYQAEPGDRVPAYLMIPHDLEQPTAGVLCLHPTSRYGKDLIAGLAGPDALPNRNYAEELAERGYVCIVPDYPSFGDYDYDFDGPQDRYDSGSMKAIWNNMRAVDLLQSLNEVDPDRIGCIGHSLGGHNALFSAVFDQRIRLIVSSCGFTAFHRYYEGNLKGWTSDRYMPAIANRLGNDPDRMPFDFPEILAAMAPRPVFVSAPLADSNFEVEGVRECERSARRIYRLFSAEDRLRFEYPDAQHDFPPQIRNAVYEFMDQRLKQGKAP